jgi:T5orf172 domain
MELKIIRDKDLKNKNIKGVYFIKNLDNRLIKIGKTKNLKARFSQIENSFKFCGNKPNLNIEGFITCDLETELEKFIHEKLKHLKVQNEWFKLENIDGVKNILSLFLLKEYSNKNKEIRNHHSKIDSMNKIKEFNITNKMLRDKQFSYKLFINIIYNCNYSIERGEWFYYGISFAKIKRWSGLDVRTIKDKLKNKLYRIKEDEFGDEHLYISKPINNFIIVNRNRMEMLLSLDEMSIRLYLLIYGWKYNKVDCLSQSMILDMIGYSSKSTPNKQKLTLVRRKLENMNLIKSEVIRNENQENIIYYKIVN